MIALWMCFVGLLDGAAFQWRYRAAVGDSVASVVGSTAVVATLRVAGIGGIASAAVEGGVADVIAAGGAYVAGGCAATWVVHRVQMRGSDAGGAL